MFQITKKLKLCMLLLLCIPSLSFALKSDQSQSAFIQADKATFNRHAGTGHFSGNVVVIQGSTKLYADKLTVYTNKKQQIIKAIAFGTPARFTTLPQKGAKRVYANASEIEYYPETAIVILIGHGKIEQNHNTFTGSHIIYNQKTGQLISKPGHNQRTTLVLQPTTPARAKKSAHP